MTSAAKSRGLDHDPHVARMAGIAYREVGHAALCLPCFSAQSVWFSPSNGSYLLRCVCVSIKAAPQLKVCQYATGTVVTPN